MGNGCCRHGDRRCCWDPDVLWDLANRRRIHAPGQGGLSSTRHLVVPSECRSVERVVKHLGREGCRGKIADGRADANRFAAESRALVHTRDRKANRESGRRLRKRVRGKICPGRLWRGSGSNSLRPRRSRHRQGTPAAPTRAVLCDDDAGRTWPSAVRGLIDAEESKFYRRNLADGRRAERSLDLATTSATTGNPRVAATSEWRAWRRRVEDRNCCSTAFRSARCRQHDDEARCCR